MVLFVDDALLVDAARAGDVDAFSELVRRHQGRVYRIALRMLESDADAQDAAQDTFVRAWRSLPRFRGESSVATWLYRIVTNRCVSMLAARRASAPLREGDVAVETDDPAWLVAQRERMDAVSRAVSRLPDDQRLALVLRDYEGLSYAEVAEVLGIGEGAVKSRIHRARAEVLKRTVGWR
ncbi:MAG TPA: sigma-70 family RNA polymerase sigma factor [Solirubrobacteraceae bacterium]|nr:sigma-70 family RNA polymerase sigma factor [Solirubrobacteraceae bacterium]